MENDYVYIEMKTLNEIKNIIQEEFNKNTKKEKKNTMCPYTGFENNKSKSKKHKPCDLRSVMTGPFNF